jgi:hypothetical protein
MNRHRRANIPEKLRWVADRSLPAVSSRYPDEELAGEKVAAFADCTNANEASPQTDESCIVPSHSGWRGSLHRRIPNDGQITAWLAKSF